jgi:acetyltransferase-like isoleucine patch superfamily enzyme
VPGNVRLGSGTVITGELTFKRFLSSLQPGVVIGRDCTLERVSLAVGVAGMLEIGDHCYATDAVLLCEQSVRLGSYVVLGWGVTIADSDFHPLDPALRAVDALALSPVGAGRARPRPENRPVVIGDDVWVGPAATILKGVTVGDHVDIEAGSVVTTDVPAGSRVAGNPARMVGRA